jgi:TolB-like protein
MKKIEIVFLIFLFLLIGNGLCYSADSLEEGLSNLSDQIVNGLYEGQKHKIAVIEFSNMDGKITEFGSFIAEELITRLFKSPKFNVIERQLLNKIIEEHRLNVSGLVDEKTAKKIGAILGVDAICSGTVTDLGKSVKINARLISTETGSIFAVASSEITKDESIKRLMSKIMVKYKETPDTKDKTVSRPATGSNFVYNGGFINRYEGWEKRIGDITQGSSKTEIIPFQNTKSGKALHIKHEGSGSIQFSQVVDVPSPPDLIFSASFQASSHEGMMTGFSGTGIVQIALQYIDENDNLIGQTILLNYVKNPFADTPLIGVPRRKSDSYKNRYIEFNSNKFYTDYKIDIRKEVEDNLLGIDVETLRKIAIVIFCSATHSQAGSELWITDISIRPK